MPPGASSYSGAWTALPASLAGDEVVETGGCLLPGFVDTHVHYPQTLTTDEFGGGELLEWLERCVFPAESRLADPAFADLVAAEFVRRRVSAGTTSALVFGSAFPEAQDALFRRTLDAGLRVVSGRGIQTVGPASAAALLTSEDAAIGARTRRDRTLARAGCRRRGIRPAQRARAGRGRARASASP